MSPRWCSPAWGALALHGRRTVRARALNAASAGASVFMNVIAAAPGWRDLAVWAMLLTAYALASDTLIGVIRTGVIARHQDPGDLAGEVTVLAVIGGVALWLLRLGMAPASTLAGFRAWVLEECPVAPAAAPPAPPCPPPVPPRPSRPAPHPTASRPSSSWTGKTTASSASRSSTPAPPPPRPPRRSGNPQLTAAPLDREEPI